ncbi:MAG TPA: helix-turn-helix domain-containing protein [Methylosinus sp.]|jgi:DNA-binding response OmpR family regulator|uniref:winged helix-turn-helix domain-containing protein n=1 Tax=Methylosinus sp. TaxID=427 RepID=UPI002F950A71
MTAQGAANDPLVLNWRVKSLLAENESLRAKVDKLECELSGARGGNDEEATVLPSLPLQAKQRRVLAFLLRRSPNFVTKSRLLTACWDEPDAVSGSVMEPQIYHLRKALRRLGVVIESRRFEGYRLPAESAARLRELMERSEASDER